MAHHFAINGKAAANLSDCCVAFGEIQVCRMPFRWTTTSRRLGTTDGDVCLRFKQKPDKPDKGLAEATEVRWVTVTLLTSLCQYLHAM